MSRPSLLQPDAVCVVGRLEEYTFEIYQADGKTPEGIAVDDVVRFKLADAVGGAPILDLSNNGPTANGSVVVIDALGQSGVAPAKGRVRLAPGDTAGLSAVRRYWELNLVDNSETNPADAIKPICRGVLICWASQGGNTGLLP